MKELIFDAIAYFTCTMGFFALSCLMAFVGFSYLVSASSIDVKSTAVFMLIVALVIFIVACVVCLNSYGDWTESYKKRNN